MVKYIKVLNLDEIRPNSYGFYISKGKFHNNRQKTIVVDYQYGLLRALSTTCHEFIHYLGPGWKFDWKLDALRGLFQGIHARDWWWVGWECSDLFSDRFGSWIMKHYSSRPPGWVPPPEGWPPPVDSAGFYLEYTTTYLRRKKHNGDSES